MNRVTKVLVPILLVMAAASTAVVAQDVAPSTDVVKIKSLNATVLPDRTRIVVETSSPLSLPSSYNLDPLVLVLDIPGADSTALQKQYEVGSPCVDRVNVYQLDEGGRKGITRLEVLMSSLVPYRIYSEGSRLYVDFEHTDISGKPAKAQDFFRKPADTEKKPEAKGSVPAPAAAPAAKDEASSKQPVAAAKAQPGEVGRLQKIDVQKGNGGLQVVVAYHGAVDYKCFELKSPHQRLVLDLINAVNAVTPDTISVKYRPVESIRVGQFQGGQPKIARIVFDLSEQASYELQPSPNQLTIAFRNAGTAAEQVTQPAATADEAVSATNEAQVSNPTANAAPTEQPAVDAGAPKPTEPAAAPAEAQAAVPSVTEPTSAPVTAQSADTATPTTTVSTEAPQQAAATTTSDAPTAADTPAPVASATDAPAAVAQAAPPVSATVPVVAPEPREDRIPTYQMGPKGLEMAEVPAPLQAPDEPPATPPAPPAAGEQPPAPPEPLSAAGTRFELQTIAAGESNYSGEPISLDLVDAPIEQVFRLISEISGLNVITDPGVTGRVTVHFKGVPWDQALDLILKTNGLGYVLENRVVRIATLATLTNEEQNKNKLREAKQLSVDLKTVTKSLSYAKVSDMETILTKMLSARGEIINDPRTNTVIISDIPDKVAAITKLVDTLDTPTPQVTIQAKIVESSANYTQNLGVQWGFQGIADARHGNQTSLKFPNNILVDAGAVGGQSGLVGPLGGYAVNLPAPAFTSGIGISLGNVLDTFRLDAALTALENAGHGRILSAPKVTTQNNIKASILQGREIPVQTTANNTTTTTFKNAALELNVTPQITAEGTIIMLLDIKNDQADFANLVNGIPPIITQKVLTTVLVRDGGTTVIGGIYRAEDSFTENKVPGLYKIPLLGYLFRNSQKTRSNRELLIFLTPRIVRD